MSAFNWNKNFETGLKEVDEQHIVLVGLVNNLSNLILHNDTNGVSLSKIESVLNAIIDYTDYHFTEEETLMYRVGLHPEHICKHIAQHEQFVADVKELYKAATLSETFLKQLYHYLTQWLVYHILGDDKNMARQVKAINSGMDAEEAFHQEEKRTEQVVEPLLSSLRSMFEEVSMRNKELILLTQTLGEQVKERTQDLERLSYTDPLTGLKNRRFIMEEFERQWRQQCYMLVIFIDVDEFKLVNDHFGHYVGDELLIQLAKILESTFYTTDVVSRLGGDEFMILCSSLTMVQAYALCEKALVKTRKIVFESNDHSWKGAISIGIAKRTPDVADVASLLKLADQSLYKSKNKGKNCVSSIQ